MKKFLALLIVLFSICLNANSQAPANDDCGSAQPVSIPAGGTACVTGTTVAATPTDWTTPECGETVWTDVWYTFISTGTNNTVVVSPTGSPAVQMLGVSLYNGTCASPVGGLPGECEISTTNGGSDTAFSPAAIGTVFYIEVASFGNPGGFNLCITSTTPPAAPGNTCATAAHLCDTSSFSVTNVPVGGSTFTPGCFTVTPTDGQWYQFTVGVSGLLAWTCKPTSPGIELDWALYDITTGCPANMSNNYVNCNYNYEGEHSDAVGMLPSSTTVCPRAGAGGAVKEFCPSSTITAGHTYAIFINNFSYPATTGWNFNFDSSTFQMAPVDTFTVSPDTICGNSGTVSITNNSVGAIWQNWSFGDGGTSAVASPGSHTYNNPGTYFISLEDSSQTGCKAVVSKSVLITPYPTVTVHNDTICAGATGTLTATASVNGGTYLWSTGATTASITASPANTTPYTVTFTSPTGCSASTTGSIVITSPTATLTASPTSICPGGSSTLTPTTGASYSWSTGPTTPTITVTPTVTTPYSVTVSFTGGCTATATTTVTVSANPTATVTPPNVGICIGGNTTLMASTGTGYTWSNGNTTQSITVAPVVQTTYTVTVALAGGCSATASGLVTINPNPTATITASPASVCSGQSSTLTVNPAGTNYVWSTGATTASITVSPNVNTNYNLTVTFASGCSATAIGTVAVGGAPAASITPSPDTICLGANATLTANGALGYLWSTGATTASITVSPAATTTYTVTAADGPTCTATVSAVVVVDPFAVTISPASSNICASNTVALTCSYTSTNPDAYTWSNSSLGNSQVVTAGPTTTTQYAVTTTDVNGCTASATAIVNVDNVVLSITPATPSVCSGQGTTLTATGTGNPRYTWSNNVFTDTNTVLPTSTTQYTVTATDTSNCTATGSVTVNLAAAPVGTFTFSPTVCVGLNDTVTFTGSASGTASYTWGFDGGNAVGTGKGPYAVKWNSSGPVVVSLTINDNGCLSVPDSQNVTVNAIPVSDAGVDTTFCSGSTVNIGTASTAGYTYSWNPATGLSSATVSNPTVTLSNTSGNIVVQKYVVNTSNNGCVSADTVTVTVYPIPVPEFNDHAPQCLPGNDFNFIAQGSFLPTATFAWTFGPNSTPPTSTSQNQTVTYSVAQTAGVSLTISQLGCVGETYTDSVTINPVPVAAFTPDTTLGCPNLNVCFTNTSTSGADATYLWNFGDGQTSTLKTPCHIYAAPGTYTVYLDVTNSNCSNSLTDTSLITIIAAPVARFTPSATIIQQPESEITFTNQSLNSSIYSWNFGGAGTSTDNNPSFSFTQYGRYNVMLVAQDALGCLDTTEVPITVLPSQSFFIPNVFTPNGDGHNDEFYIEMQEGVTVIDFTVFDRWGEKVHDGQYPWDGTFKGKPCPEGVYVYVFKLQLASNSEGVKRTGSVTLLK